MRIVLLFIIGFGCLFMVLHSPAAAEVTVILKNGRVIVADSCRNAKDNIICEKLGGTFEFSRKDILDVKEITLQRDNGRVSSVPESASGAEELKNSTKSVGAGHVEKSQEGVLRGTDSGQETRLKQITQRKLELKAEREALLRERETLQQEVNEANDRLAIKTLNAIQRKSGITHRESLRQRSADLDSRIEKFSSELKSLNEEEAGLLASRQ